MTSRYLKDPDAVLDWTFDWKAETNGTDTAAGDWLGASETITSYTVTVDTGLTKYSDSPVSNDTAIQVWLSGGTAGEKYEVTCSIVTSEGRKDDRTLTIYVMER